MSAAVEILKTDSFSMKYFKFGTGEKTAVIIPGLSLKSVTESAASVESAYRAMKNDYTVYVFDRRMDCAEPYTVEDMADDMAAAFDALGIRGAYVFGASQGGMIGLTLAIKCPDLVSKLAVSSTAARMTADNQGVVLEWVRLAEEGDADGLIDSFINKVYTKGFAEKYGAIIKQMLGDVSDAELNRFIVTAKACKGFDIYDRLADIKCPVLVIGARYDMVLGAESSVELAEKAKAELYIYEDYGHAVYDEAPDHLSRLMSFFEDQN